MSALKLAGPGGLLACALLAGASAPARAQENAGAIRVDLTEAPEPDGKAWEDPARISVVIDPDGPDTFSAQLNLELVKPIVNPTGRDRTIRGFLRWNRESGGDDRQNNLEIGGSYTIGYNPPLDRVGDSTPEEQANFIDVSSRFNVGYARTALYPDLSSPDCTATPTLPQCQTQFKESIRGAAAFNIFTPFLERRIGPGLAYSIEPRLGVNYDHLLNSPVSSATGDEIGGGYLSALGGVALAIVPSFISPRWELEASVQLRQRLYASDSRRDLIESSAVLFEGSATYYFLVPRTENGWRAGLGVVYTRGDDPLTGQNDVNRLVLALRVGRY